MKKNARNRMKGAAMIEYVLIVGLIGIAAVAIMTTVGGSVSKMFTTVNSKLATP